MGQHKFIPISVKDNFLFVAVAKSSDKDEISNLLKTKFENPLKFIKMFENCGADMITVHYEAAENLSKYNVGCYHHSCRWTKRS